MLIIAISKNQVKAAAWEKLGCAKYLGEFKPKVEKEWSLVYYAVDKVGNSEAESGDWKNGVNVKNQFNFLSFLRRVLLKK